VNEPSITRTTSALISHIVGDVRLVALRPGVPMR
jgi:hypothetical protein